MDRESINAIKRRAVGLDLGDIRKNLTFGDVDAAIAIILSNVKTFLVQSHSIILINKHKLGLFIS